MAYKLQHDYGLLEDYIGDWFIITTDNWLLTLAGYASDGATSFPDFKWLRTPAIAIHDPLCNAIELGVIPESFNDTIDRELEIAIEGNRAASWIKRKMLGFRGWYIRKGTNTADSKLGAIKKIKELPKLKHEYTIQEYQRITGR